MCRLHPRELLLRVVSCGDQFVPVADLGVDLQVKVVLQEGRLLWLQRVGGVETGEGRGLASCRRQVEGRATRETALRIRPISL